MMLVSMIEDGKNYEAIEIDTPADFQACTTRGAPIMRRTGRATSEARLRILNSDHQLLNVLDKCGERRELSIRCL